MSLLSRKRQLAFKTESQEGTAETLTASEAGLLVEMGFNKEFNPEMIARNPASSTLSKYGDLIGKRPSALTFKVRLRGPGDLTTEAKIAELLKACGCQASDLKKITIGAVTSGPFKHLETISGAGGGTGKVICDTANGETTLYYVVLTGVIVNGEVITGGTSGAKATVGSAPADSGHVLLPVSSPASVPSLTMGVYNDGLRKLSRGCRGDVKINYNNGQPVELEFNFMGVEAGITDTAMLTNITNESIIEPVLLGATFTLDGSSMLFNTLGFSFGNTLAQRDDVTDSRGIKSFYISDRQPTGEIDPEMLLVASHDFHGKWFAGTKMELDLMFGSTDGNKHRLYIPQIQYSKIAAGEREGIEVAQTSFKACKYLSAGDDEFAILFL